ncbi:MAG: hypothetical protein FWD66_02045 [Paludibacter sp.]|nr:hypothetical protein [Paludibacter sp.]
MKKHVKKIIVLICTSLLLSGYGFGQVGIGVQAPAGKESPDNLPVISPQGMLHLQGQQYVNDTTIRNVGFVLPKVDNVESVVTPQGGNAVMGTMVFVVPDTFDIVPSVSDFSVPGCLKVRTAEGWSDCLSEISDISNYFNFDVYGGLNMRVKKVSAGQQYSLVIGYLDNAVYATGINGNGRTAVGTIAGQTTTFKMILAHRTLDISAGRVHALVVTQSGCVWSWGEGGYGRTANSTALAVARDFVFPVQVKSIPLAAGDTIIRVEAGDLTSMVMSKNGKVYAFGRNTNAQIGNGVQNATGYMPTLVTFPTSSAMKDIALSNRTAAAIDMDGNVYMWGNAATSGATGTGATIGYVTSPTQITFPVGVKIKQVALGTNHGLAVSEDGKHLYGWGAAQGWGGSVGTTAAVQPSPVEVTDKLISGGFNPATDVIVSIAASRFTTNVSGGTASTTVGGSIVITDKNIYAAGSNNNPERWGLGVVPKSTTTIYSPSPATGLRGLITSGFLPMYDKTIYPGTYFDQASIGVTHSLFKQTLVLDDDGAGTITESGSYGYGVGEVINNELGAVDATFATLPLPQNIKQ